MAPVSLVFAILATYFCFADGLSVCITPDRQNGRCKPINDCPPLLELSKKQHKTQQDLDFLKKSDCSLPKKTPMICCPNPCYTPEAKPGKCVGLQSCPHLANMLIAPVPDKNIQYVSQTKCAGSEKYSVCCGPPPQPKILARFGGCSSTALPPDPNSDCCGLHNNAGNRITGGNATSVDQYPWLVIIEYVKLGNIRLMCGGALISGRYVLSAAHCVTGDILGHGTPKNVRLGEYNTKNEGADCVPVDGGGTDCTDGMIVIPIEKTISHPNYDTSKKQHDIALIRLAQSAPFTDFIKPICLPSVDITLTPPDDFFLYAAGWGAVSEEQRSSDVKQDVDLPFVNNQQCKTAYQTGGISVRLTSGQLCAGGVPGKDSCKGDSGGPLMYENGRIFELTGLVSFGPKDCGSPNIPGVYTKVSEYKNWIMNTIVE